MHIAYVTETYPPELNGVALTAARAIGYLQERGHRVDVIRPRQKIDGTAAADPNHVLVRGMPLPRYPELQMGLPARSPLMRRWRQQRPDVVHIATEGPLGWSALRAARRLGIPATSDYRTHFQRYSGHYGLGPMEGAIDAYLRAFHNRATITFVATEELEQELKARGYRNLACVGRGVDTTLFSPRRRRVDLRARWGVGSGGLAVLYVGRLAPEKNPVLAARTFAAIRRVVPDARLIWVGDGPLSSDLRCLRWGHVFAGVQLGEALADYYASADLFLFPSETETFGNVLIEAMASGLACVAYDRGAARQHLVDGVSGRCVPVGDATAFVAAGAALAASPMTMARMRREASRAIAGLTWDAVLAPFENHLRQRAAAAAPAILRPA